MWRCDANIRDVECRHAVTDGSTIYRDMRIKESVNVSGADRCSQLTSASESQIAARYHPSTDVISELGWPLRQVVGDDDNTGEDLEIPVIQDGPDGPLAVAVVHHYSSNPTCGSHFLYPYQLSRLALTLC